MTLLYKNSRVCNFRFFVFGDGFGKLVGTRGVVTAENAGEKFLYLVDIFSFNQSAYALQIAAAAANEFYVVKSVLLVNFEIYLS